MAKAMNDRVWREAPAEKVQATLRQAEIARVMEKTGSTRSDGLGQKVGGIDARTFMRWHQQYPGCWENKKFREDFLASNPQCRAPGYKAGGGALVFDMGRKS